ncbi:MAG: MFS transporter [Candidatus Lokiarchaeota archaeon]|nr:MFS transporter [Candidatus Lokiarchaeota archaeon]MBD3342764.1 MFS transporter [Candidatus Lokiarchaeota archaeon]
MSKKKSNKLPKRFVVCIILFSLAGEIAWAVENQYYNVFMYNVIAPVPFYISIMVALSTIVGTVAAIIMGSYSDVKGKRKPILLYGFIFWAITTVMFPFAAFLRPVLVAVAIAILFDCVMTFFGSTAYNAGFNAYVTDDTKIENRGKATGISQITFLLAILIVYGASGFLITWFGYFIFFYIIGGLVAVLGVLGGILMDEPEGLQPLNVSTYVHLKKSFSREQTQIDRNFFWVLIVIAVWNIGLYVYFPYLLIYLQHYIGLSITLASILVFIALAISIVLAYPIGMFTDKLGRKNIAIISTIAYAIAVILFAFTSNLVLLVVFGVFWVVCMTALRITTWTWAKDLYPTENRGQFSGFMNAFSGTIPMLIGPFIGAWIATVYGTSISIGGVAGNVPPPLIFIVGGLIILLTLIPIYFAKEHGNEEK